MKTRSRIPNPPIVAPRLLIGATRAAIRPINRSKAGRKNGITKFWGCAYGEITFSAVTKPNTSPAISAVGMTFQVEGAGPFCLRAGSNMGRRNTGVLNRHDVIRNTIALKT